MSRKTRKLMWSAPLIAAVAVIGALAAFVILGPGGAQAHQPVRDANGDVVSTLHLPPGPVTDINVVTPSLGNGGRTSLQVSWNAPTSGDPVDGYRVDVSTDTNVWMNVIGGEQSGSGTLTESMAMSNCLSSDKGNRCYTATDLMPGTLYHFRVFAMNDKGTSPISVGVASGKGTIESGMTLPIDPPARVDGLQATNYLVDEIIVSWDKVTMTGGADVLWYCLGVAQHPAGAFLDLTDAVTDTTAAQCLNAEEEDSITDAEVVTLLGSGGNVATASPTAVIAAMKPVLDDNGDPVEDADGNVVMEDNLSYTHEKLGGGGSKDNSSADDLADVINLRYRLYAVTDPDGDPETTEGRRISRAASEVATGGTVAPDATAPTPAPIYAPPGAVGNLRAVAYTTDATLPAPTEDNQGLHFFWTHPEGYDPEFVVDAEFGTGDDDAKANWRLEVQRRVPSADDHDDYTGWQFVPGGPGTSGLATGYGTAQFTVTFGQEQDLTTDPDSPAYGSPVLWGDGASNRNYRVRYVNEGADDETDAGHQNTDRTDDEVGPWVNIEIPSVTANYFRNDAIPDNTSTLPIILLSSGNVSPNLRFEYSDSNRRDEIKLVWTRNASADTRTGQNDPNGYVIDRSEDGDTWVALTRADSPTELGTALDFEDRQDVVPGKEYIYRVFPVFIEAGPNAYGIPGLVTASSRGADLPEAVRSLTAMADGTDTCVINWQEPSDHGGHPVKGYLIRRALDVSGNPGTWTDVWVRIDVDGTPTSMPSDSMPYTIKDGSTTTFEYTGTLTDGLGQSITDATTQDALSPGSMRWFQVIPITHENDGLTTTGGYARNASDGSPHSPVDDGDTARPGADSLERATPVKCTTDDLGAAPPDQVPTDPMPPHMPVDLTVEAASDTNSLATSERGVFLTWNQQPQGMASATTHYRIYRTRANTGIAALDTREDADGNPSWLYLTRVMDVTSYTDDTELRRDAETRMYRVCSEAQELPDLVCVAMPVDYALHMNHAPDAPMNVMADSSADGTMLTVSWDAAGSDGGSAITGYKVMYKMTGSDGDYMSMDAAADATSATIENLSPNTSYSIAVVAVNAVGDSAMGMGSGMTVDIVPGMPTASAKADDMNGRTQINVSWMAPADNGGSAITSYIVEQSYMGMFLDDGIAHPDFVFSNHMEWWETLNCAGMLLAVGSDADPEMDSDDKAMYCGHFLNTAPTNITDATKELSDAAKADVEMYFNKRYMITDAMTMSASFMGLNPGAEYMYRVKAVNAAGAGAWSETASATTTANMMPMAGDAIGDMTVTEGAMDGSVNLSMHFTDGDDDVAMLTYTAESSNEAVAKVSVDGSMLTIMYGEVGEAKIKVTAKDMFYAEAMQEFMVTVESGAALSVESSDAGAGTITIKWQAIDGAISYHTIAYNSNDDFSYKLASVSDPLSVTFDSLTSGNAYRIAIAAAMADGSFTTVMLPEAFTLE